MLNFSYLAEHSVEGSLEHFAEAFDLTAIGLNWVK